MNSSSKKNIANFFWHGGKLTIYDLACLKSFSKNGFKVIVYSFDKLKLPKKIINKDANILLNKNEHRKFIHGGKKNCLAAYADKFRIILQSKNLGWWFDLDVMCLKKHKSFNKLQKNKKLIIGYETDNKVNNAVLKINSNLVSTSLLKKIDETGYKFEWGKIGPTLLNDYINNHDLKREVLNKNYFYPINFKNIELLFNPNKVNEAIKLTNKSFTIHLYNQILNRMGIPKNILPPKNSYLYNTIIKTCPEFKNIETLPESTFFKLLNKKNGFKENLFDLIPSFLRAIKRY
jgi:hypothetical protein